MYWVSQFVFYKIRKVIKETLQKKNMFKGTVDVISSEPPFKEVNVRLPTYPINF